MPYLTLTVNLKLQLSPGLVASYDIQPKRSGFILGQIHTRLLTYLLAPDPHGAFKV